MRWDGMRIQQDAPASQPPGILPGAPAGAPASAAPALFERGAIARSFDTPGFRGMTFFEVHARSIINRVPESSRVPFRWTINPYRGCSHACKYCLVGGTPILMADGRSRALADLRPGDEIYGTVRRGNYRRYVHTTVLAHWQTVKPAYRVTLADGTRLITSGEHRFLSERGWKHVTGAESGPLQRPHLTTSNKLMGVGGFAGPPKAGADYRRGYLCGMIRGDGCIYQDRYQRVDGSTGYSLRFRLALADQEALERTRGYLARIGIGCAEFTFAEATPTRRQVAAIRNGGRDQVRMMEWLIGWPDSPTLEWRKGFLAGIFDAEGSYSNGILRICNTDPDLLAWIRTSLQEFGFAFAVERRHIGRAGPVTNYRLTGGLPEKLRFFLSTDPAITCKRSIEGTAIRSNARLGIASIEPLGLDLPMFDITTGTGDFIANGVVSHNCFARNTHTYLDLDAGHDFDSKIVVKVNAPELVRKELTARKWQGEHIAMGTNVDCYQRAEGRYRLMPGILQALLDARNPYSILTKGTLILRDLDLLIASADVTDVGLSVSVGCADEDLWRTLEPGTPSPRHRLGVCATLSGHGLPCGVLMGPVVPFLSDSPAQLESTVRQVAEAGASHVSPIVLHLRPGAREWFLAWLAEHHPALVPRYRGLYGSRAYAPGDYQQRIAEQVRELAERYQVGRGSPRRTRRTWRGAAAGPGATPDTAAAPVPEQLTLL
ncbi:MAG TPA: intein-containing Rv2578c family radical SAM protein [Streptosporangiaceae bacterium]|nr:intein-containing Rv2578c family radical SAM protein [Streptosporangiaceae bacterium]